MICPNSERPCEKNECRSGGCIIKTIEHKEAANKINRYLKLLSSGQEVQASVATEDDQGTKAGNIKNI